MTGYKIHYGMFIVVSVLSIIYICVMAYFIGSVYNNGLECKEALGAETMKIDRVDLLETYGSQFGAITSIKDQITDGDQDISIADDSFSYFSYKKADGTDAIDSRDKFIIYYSMTIENSSIVTIAFLVSAIEVLIFFIGLCYSVFADQKKLWFFLGMAANILVMCVMLSDAYYLLLLGLVATLAAIVLNILHVRSIQKLNYRIAHRYDNR